MKRSDGLKEETNFWKQWISGRGGKWSTDFERRLDPATVLQEYVQEVLPRGQSRARILDVGSGPLTILGKTSATHLLEIVSVDPLRDIYTELLSKEKIQPLVPVLQAEAEALTELFAEDSFDVIHMSNALDHSRDPLTALEEMLTVVRPGGIVILAHPRNEGEKNKYHGLHQWNIDVDRNRPILWNPSDRFEIKSLFGHACQIKSRTTETYCYIQLEKTVAGPVAKSGHRTHSIRQMLRQGRSRIRAGYRRRAGRLLNRLRRS